MNNLRDSISKLKKQENSKYVKVLLLVYCCSILQHNSKELLNQKPKLLSKKLTADTKLIFINCRNPKSLLKYGC